MAISKKFLKDLNNEQKAAVETTEGPMIIIAGAGTGKTKVITSKIAYIIDNKIAKPEEILALTFTDKAAEEMRSRMDLMLEYGVSNADISTFHSFGEFFIRENAIEIGLTPEYKLMNRAEEIYFVKENLFKFNLNYYRPISNPSKFIEAILIYFSKLKDEDIDEESYSKYIEKLKKRRKDEDLGNFDSLNSLNEYIQIHEELLDTFIKYENLKKENGYLNFTDLISIPLNTLRTKNGIREYYQKKYKYILVDEYQDTNYTQNEIVKIIASKNSNLCVCGDDDQSIYKFRGASISNILKFEENFPKAKKFVLNQNYRSSQNILDSAYRLISQNNPNRLEVISKVDKKLKAVNNKTNLPVLFNHLETLNDEMQYIVEQINEVKEKNNLSFSDFAILIRSNSQAQPIIRELNINNIPFKYQGNTGLYETNEVRILLSFLYSLSRIDDTINLFNLSSSGIYNLSMNALIEANSIAKMESKNLLFIFKSIDLYESNISDEDRKIIKQIYLDIEKYRELSRNENVGTILLEYIKEKNFLEQISDNKNGVENIQKFFQRIDRFINTTNFSNLNQFCDYLDYTREMGDDPAAAEIDPTYDAVNILTIHKAKGMEFNTVFMIDLVEGRFPTREMKDPILIPDELIKEILPKENSFHEQEERRLFYVGMTRAKERLYLLGAKDYYLKNTKRISAFVNEALGLGKDKSEKPVLKQIKQEIKKKENTLNTDKITLTQSQIEDYLTCPLKYFYIHHLKIDQKTNFNVFLGSLIHKAAEQILLKMKSGVQINDEDVLGILDNEWKDRGFLSQGHISEAYNHTKKILLDFSRNNKLEPEYIEKSFKVKIDDKTNLEGRWDLIDKNHSIIDFKTTIIKDEKEALQRAKESIQLKIYAWAYEKTYNMLPEKLEIYFFSKGIKVGYKPTKKTIDDAKKLIDQVLNGIRENNFEPNPSFMACSFCQFNKICSFTLSN